MKTDERPVLETERLVLRPWKTADADELFRLASDPNVGPIAGWPAHESADESRMIIETVLGAPETYAVVLCEAAALVGSVGLLFGDAGTVPLAPGEAEVGYWAGVPFWGRGLIPEAVREIERHAFCDLGLARLWCACAVENAKSVRVQEKCGFSHCRTERDVVVRLTGEVHDERVSVLSRDDWAASADAGELRRLLRREGRMAVTTAGGRSKRLVGEVFEVWHASVRAAHDFLGEDDVARIADYVPDAFRAVETLLLARGSAGELLGFAGVSGDDLEMLFVRPESRGAGVGKALLRIAVEGYGVTRLDVNEQNSQARGFYEHAGFVAVGRSETDAADPFPIVHLALEQA